MRFETVSNEEEYNFMINQYIANGYKVETRGISSARLVKNEFSVGVFIVLLFLLIIGGLIYWAVKSGQKDVVVIRIGNNNAPIRSNIVPTSEPSNPITVAKYCVECGNLLIEESKFCQKCGKEL
ncbi:MAG: zinc ribbon domain-containing protein [Methanobacteriaceae archaeon]